jgi:hypothetical protein
MFHYFSLVFHHKSEIEFDNLSERYEKSESESDEVSTNFLYGWLDLTWRQI